MSKITKKRMDGRLKSGPLFTRVAQLLIFLAGIVMLVIYAMHRPIAADIAWANYALMMFVFATFGWLGTQIAIEQPIFPAAEQLKPIDLNTGVRAALILAACLITQLISQVALAFTTAEQAMYFIFAAVCEEVFFRVCIITLFLKMRDDFNTRVLAVVVQAIAFAAIHVNYYGDPAMLLSVLLGGIILGIFFVVWRDPTANILAHFVLNLIAVQNLLVVL